MADTYTDVFETTTEALAPTAEGGYGQEPRSLEDPTYAPAQEVLADYWERTNEAAEANGGVSGNQDGPSYQPTTEILTDPESDETTTPEQIEPLPTENSESVSDSPQS